MNLQNKYVENLSSEEVVFYLNKLKKENLFEYSSEIQRKLNDGFQVREEDLPPAYRMKRLLDRNKKQSDMNDLLLQRIWALKNNLEELKLKVLRDEESLERAQLEVSNRRKSFKAEIKQLKVIVEQFAAQMVCKK